MAALTPFAGLRPAPTAAHAQWVLDQLVRPSPTTVAFRVPRGFEAIVRVHHPLEDHQAWASVFGGDAVAAGAPAIDERVDQRDDLRHEAEHELADRLVTEVLPDPDDVVHFGLWVGWGWLEPGSSRSYVIEDGRCRRDHDAEVSEAERMRPVFDFVRRCPRAEWWGGRPMLLFDGPSTAVASIGMPLPGGSPLCRQFPQWWWPPDRSWFIGMEIDDACYYVAGSEALVGRVERLGYDTVRVAITDPW